MIITYGNMQYKKGSSKHIDQILAILQNYKVYECFDGEDNGYGPYKKLGKNNSILHYSDGIGFQYSTTKKSKNYIKEIVKMFEQFQYNNLEQTAQHFKGNIYEL